MVMALRKRIGRMLSENKARYAGLLILLFLASFTLAAASGMGSNLENMVGGFAVRNMQEDLSFSTDLPIEDVDSLTKEAGAAIDPYRYVDVTLSGGAPLRLLSPCQGINLPAVKSGSPLRNSGEILLDPYFCRMHEIAVGDTIEADGETYKVVGTVAIPHYVYALKNINDVMPPSGFGIGLVSEGDMTAYENNTTVYAVRFENREDIGKQSAALHRFLDQEGYSLLDWADAMNNKRIRMPWASITGVTTMSAVLPVVTLLLCALIAGSMMWRILLSDSTMIGTFYAQGYRKRELLAHYLSIPVLLSVAGGVLGTVCGLLSVAPGVRLMISTYYNVPDTGIAVSPLTVAAGIFLPAIFLAVACILVIDKMLKKTARELMRGDGQKAKMNFLERRIKLDRFKFDTKFQIREQVRSIPRLVFLLLGVTAASVMILFGFAINNSWKTALGSDSMNAYHFTYEYSFKQIQQTPVPEGCEPFNAIRCYPEGREAAEFYVMGMPEDSGAITLLDDDGSELPKSQVNITYPLASRLNLKEGDRIDFYDKLNETAYSLTVDGIVETYTGQFLYMPLKAFNEMTGYEAGSYSGLFSNEEMNFDDRLLSGVKNLKTATSAADDLSGTMTGMVAFLTAIASLMGIIIIFLVTSLMIEENRTTISMLKIFGYRKKEIKKLVLRGAVPVVVLGFLLGIPVMLLSANAMYGYLGEMINIVLPIVINPIHIVISFVIVLLVYLFTQKLCERKLNRIAMDEVLKANAE